MLRHLSFLNAKRQVADYLIYFVTLLLAIVLLYGFNSLIFSPEMTPIVTMQMAGMKPLTYFVSFLIVVIIGWLVNYMLKFMLTKRGRELGTYMLVGISNRQISQMILMENSLLGAGALVLGIPCGVFFAEILKAATMVILGQNYHFSLSLSREGMQLTIVYVLLIFVVALLLNRRQLKKLTLKELIYLESIIGKNVVTSSYVQLFLFAVAVVSFAAGVYCLVQRPFVNAYDILLGLAGCTLFVFLFFESLSGVVVFWIEKHQSFLYRKHRLILYRTFAAKMHSLKRTLQALGVLFMLGLCCLAMASGISKVAEKRQQFVAFDVVVLHQGSATGMRDYDPILSEVAKIQESYAYNLYHNRQTGFSAIRQQEIADYQVVDMEIKESQYDTYMKLSDYQVLRKMLGLQPVKIMDSGYFIHCLDYLEPALSAYGKQHPLKLAGELELAGVYTEDFNQYTDYGNGNAFILVVPDRAVANTSVLYSLYAAQIKSFADQTGLSEVIQQTPNLTTLLNGSGMMSTVNNSLLVTKDDYVFGRKIENEGSDGLPMILPITLLGIIFCITGATILAVQLLSDRRMVSQQDILLDHLGEAQSQRRKILRNQVLLYFLVPLLPALFAGNVISWILVLEIIRGSFFTTPIPSAKLWALEVIPLVNLIFLVTYVIYGLIVYRQLRQGLER